MYIEIIKIIAPALIGGGLWHAVMFRIRKKSEENRVAKEEFDSVAEIVEKATNKLSAMADQIGKIQQEKIILEAELSKVNSVARQYQAEAERWKAIAESLKK